MSAVAGEDEFYRIACAEVFCQDAIKRSGSYLAASPARLYL